MEADTSTLDPHLDENSSTTAVAGAPVTTPQTPEFKATEDGNQIEYGGRKYLREEAVHQERQRAQSYAQTLEQLQPLMPQFERFLSAEAQRNQATVDRSTRHVESDYTDDELQGYAITRGYYDTENKPDTKRAAADLDVMTAIADRRANRVAGPIAQQSAADRARVNIERAMAQTFTDGQPIADPKYLSAVAQSLPDEMKADPNVANMISVIAAGLQALDDRKAGRSRTRREPTFREGSNGSFSESTADSLDALGRAAARARGKTPEQWTKMQKSVGGTNTSTGYVLDEV